ERLDHRRRKAVGAEQVHRRAVRDRRGGSSAVEDSVLVLERRAEGAGGLGRIDRSRLEGGGRGAAGSEGQRPGRGLDRAVESRAHAHRVLVRVYGARPASTRRFVACTMGTPNGLYGLVGSTGLAMNAVSTFSGEICERGSLSTNDTCSSARAKSVR